jgi:hypothetical protein
MYRWFGVVPQGFVVLFPVVLGGDFQSPLLVVFLGLFSGPCSWGFDGGNSCEPIVVLLPLIPLPNPRVKGLDFGAFGVLEREVFLRVDFHFLLIEWVLGTELLAKGSSRGTPTIPKVSLWSVERIGRSIGGRFEFFPRAVFFPTVQEKTGLTSFPNRSHRFRPVGCREEFLSKEVSVALWLLLFRCGKALEVFWVFGEFLDKVGLTGLPNRSDRFPLTAWG